MEWTVIVGIVCTVLGAVLSYVAFSRNKSKDDKTEGQQTGVVLTELGYIKSGVDDLTAENREQHRVNTEVYSRLSAVESSAKQAHHRIDRLETEAINGL